MSKQPLVGVWKLVSFESRDDEGNVSYPWGKDTVGYLTYTAEGYVAVSIMSKRRPRFSSADLQGGTPEEKAAAVDTYISYCGRYELQSNAVIHHIELSLFPNWIGVDQKRIFSLEDGRLSLKTQPIAVNGIQQTHHLIWERVERPT